VRVYLAATAALLKELADHAQVAGPLEGFAATESLRRELGDVSDEDLEFALAIAAGESSAAMVGLDDPGRGRRFVLVADIDGADASADDATPGAVEVRGPVLLAQVDAVLADPEDIALHAGISDELAWFATQEIGDLLA
jgi:hypothetical protein